MRSFSGSIGRVRLMLRLMEDQGRGVEAWPGTLKARRWEVGPDCGAAADGRKAPPETDGGGGTGSRGRTPIGAAEPAQPLKTKPASKMAETDTK
ncbi:hypothetical protein [Microvirga lotononidis]|uniref:hypothetical protein n=1 Tax=Microvirga lotononidis TaxID=864069 RepID=UPI0002FC779F|nr:hypothetical protein [Microvirga lotononidis]WQO27560.1 hypothetical protein U0023_00125 [Microvirga lotononidis]